MRTVAWLRGFLGLDSSVDLLGLLDDGIGEAFAIVLRDHDAGDRVHVVAVLQAQELAARGGDRNCGRPAAALVLLAELLGASHPRRALR